MSYPWYKRFLAWLGRHNETEDFSQNNEEQLLYKNDSGSYRRRTPFRFPLIPDHEPIGLDIEKIGQTRRDEKEERFELREQTKCEGNVKPREERWLIKSRDVPSPIFGFQKRDRSIYNRQVNGLHSIERETPEIAIQSENDLQQEFNLQTETVIELEDTAHSIQLMDHRKDFDQPLNSEVLDDPINFKQFPEMNQDVHQHQENFIDLEEVDLEEVDLEDFALHPVSHHANHEETTSQNLHKKPSGIPFNVLYFGKETESLIAQGKYQLPPLTLLKPSPKTVSFDLSLQEEMIGNLERTLHSFNVKAKVIGVKQGPTVTRIEVQPGPGVKVNRITNLSDDIKLNLAAKDIRIEAPIPGKSAVGIEVPNPSREPVNVYDVISTEIFKHAVSPLTVALGKDIEGKPIITDLAKMPHGLIAGSTGSGKSVCINSIIISLLYKTTPEEVKLILIDPKMVELAPYNNLPHLATPVVTDAKQATSVLKWAVEEMERRYELFAQNGVRDLNRYNEFMAERYQNMKQPALPYILIIIDELADLMMVAPSDVEDSIARIAQKARACGIHLLLATQRPSVDVITGMIKANIPTRIAFAVSSQIDSRTILDRTGAERLLGQGDMLILESGGKAYRLQGNYVSDEEIEAVCQFVRNQRKPEYLFDKESLITSLDDQPEDELFAEALKYVVEQELASSSSLQRRFRIGYNRAARLVDMMEERGFISGAVGSKPRNVLLSKTEFEELFPDSNN